MNFMVLEPFAGGGFHVFLFSLICGWLVDEGKLWLGSDFKESLSFELSHERQKKTDLG